MPNKIDLINKHDVILPASSSYRVSVEQSTNLILATKNQDFSAAPDWTAADGWALSGATWKHTATKVGITELTSAYMATCAIRKGYRYDVVFTVSAWTVGTLTPAIGNVPGIAVAANGTYTQRIQAAYDDVSLIFIPTSTFDGAIDNVSIKAVKDLIRTDSNGCIITSSDANAVATFIGNEAITGTHFPLMPAHGTVMKNDGGIFKIYDTCQGGWVPNTQFGSTVSTSSLSKGLLCCFNLDDDAASTAVTDSTGRVTGTASVNTDVLSDDAGKLGKCFKFRGGASNDGITLTGLETTPGQYLCRGKPWSVNFWVNSSSVAAETFVGTSALGTIEGIGITRNINDTVQIIWTRTAGGNYKHGSTTNVLTNATWVMVTVTYNGNMDVEALAGNYKIYLNGTKETLINVFSGGVDCLQNSDCALNPWSIAKFAEDVGNVYDTTAYMDQVLIWNRELTAAEVALLYNAGAGLAF